MAARIVGGADVRNAVTGASLKEYFDEYRRFGTELGPDEEIGMNKRYVAGGYLISNQLQASVAGTLANNWLIGLPSDFLGQFVPMIQKVSAEQVRDMGKKYFSPESAIHHRRRRQGRRHRAAEGIRRLHRLGQVSPSSSAGSASLSPGRASPPRSSRQ